MVKNVYIWEERKTNRSNLADRTLVGVLAKISAMGLVGPPMISEMVSRWRSQLRVWDGPVGGWKECLYH